MNCPFAGKKSNEPSKADPGHRLSKVVTHLQPNVLSGQAQNEYVQNYRKKLRLCREDLWKFIDEINCNPILVRLAWHDSGTYDRTIKSWPECGGANGSIRFEAVQKHSANAGLSKALNYLKPLKEKYPDLSWADIIQLASVVAVEHSGGPVIPIRFGRVDIVDEKQCPKEGNLPSANPPFPDGSPDAAVHLRRVFYRMGFDDKDIVVLSGAHTLGRAFAERSGAVKEGYGPTKGTEFTKPPHTPRNDRKQGLGMAGGRSFTVHWLEFNNEYYNFDKEKDSDKSKLLQLSTDKVLFVDERFKVFAEFYAKNPFQWFKDYVKAHQKLSELGSKFNPSCGFYM